MSLRHRIGEVVAPEQLDEAAEATCEACDAPAPLAFYECLGVPTQTCVLLDSHEEASRYPEGDVLLAFCERCGFIQNTRFDPDLVDYSKPTEESQAFSATFNEFATDLADELHSKYRLDDREVLEIGCGKGDFLLLLAQRGIKHGIGLDPGYQLGRVDQDGVEIEFIKDWFGPDKTHLTADLVITRHLMEHVPNVGQFFEWLVESVTATEGAALFTEVPDTSRVLEEGAFWDIYYEHCSYFTLGSLARVLRSRGMGLTRLSKGFDDQYLLAESVPVKRPKPHEMEDSPDEIGVLVERFAREVSHVVERWRRSVEGVLLDGGRVAVWGGGSKAVAFISSLGLGDLSVIDINPHKQGKWLPSIGLLIEPPESLIESPPDWVLVMNPIYSDEIQEHLHSMGLHPRLTAI